MTQPRRNNIVSARAQMRTGCLDCIGVDQRILFSFGQRRHIRDVSLLAWFFDRWNVWTGAAHPWSIDNKCRKRLKTDQILVQVAKHAAQSNKKSSTKAEKPGCREERHWSRLKVQIIAVCFLTFRPTHLPRHVCWQQSVQSLLPITELIITCMSSCPQET